MCIRDRNKLYDEEIYSNLPVIVLHFDLNNKVVFKLKQTTFNVVRSSSSIFILLELDCNLPSTDLVITFAYNSINLSTQFDTGKDTITFTKEAPIGNITMSPTSSVPTLGTMTLKITASGTNVNSYDFSSFSGITIIIYSGTVGNSITLTEVASATNIITDTFQFTCTSNGMALYHVGRRYLDDSTQCSRTQSQILAMVQNIGTVTDNSLYPCESQYGVYFNYGVGSAFNVDIQNLKAGTNYQINGVCQDFVGTYTLSSPIYFSTYANGGKNTKIIIEFLSTPTTQQLTDILCQLTIQFSLYPKQVQTIDGLYCDSLLYFGNYESVSLIRILADYISDSYGPLVLPSTYETYDCSYNWKKLYATDDQTVTRVSFYLCLLYTSPSPRDQA
eukprot:TRINITY_DN12062_c0_g1_i1.p1 TRINITY_DN12062_c0_g1~~TRINITY_DN12062_c0_g1_i1.p1  ORF type:complete len:389 (+),score=40.00 TRINITY_DN12062_c0_g1_i1:190-1356(+)